MQIFSEMFGYINQCVYKTETPVNKLQIITVLKLIYA